MLQIFQNQSAANLRYALAMQFMVILMYATNIPQKIRKSG